MLSTEHIGFKLAAYYRKSRYIQVVPVGTRFYNLERALQDIETMEGRDESKYGELFPHEWPRPTSPHIDYFIRLAEVVATESHFHQKDKSGSRYIEHPRRVAYAAACSPDNKEIALTIQVAWLHDVIEDTKLTLTDLWNLGFDDDVVGAVDNITRRVGEAPENYYKRVLLSPISTAVKHHDINENMDPERLALLDEPTRTRLIKKYTKARDLLKGDID